MQAGDIRFKVAFEEVLHSLFNGYLGLSENSAFTVPGGQFGRLGAVEWFYRVVAPGCRLDPLLITEIRFSGIIAPPAGFFHSLEVPVAPGLLHVLDGGITLGKFQGTEFPAGDECFRLFPAIYEGEWRHFVPGKVLVGPSDRPEPDLDCNIIRGV